MANGRIRIAADVQRMEISVIKEMAMRAARLPDALSLAWGVPSFPTPPYIRAAVSAAFETDPEIGRYSLPDGLPALRALIASQHTAATGIAIDPDRDVLVTAGNMQGMLLLFHVLLEAADEVIVTDPGFASHVQQLRLVGAQPRYWPLDERRGWALDIDALPDLIGPRTRAIVLVSPSIPTGRIFARETLLAVGRLAREHGLMILLDDPYSRFVYSDASASFDLASVADLREHLAHLFTFSKCYAMSGWRLGYMILPPGLKEQVLKVQDANLICPPRVSQIAGLAALTATEQPWPAFARILEARRARICARLDRLPELFTYQRPEGAYYVFPRILTTHTDSRQFALDLLATARVSVTPGSGFGPRGEHHVRMAYCVAEDVIDASFDRIEAWFARRRG